MAPANYFYDGNHCNVDLLLAGLDFSLIMTMFDGKARTNSAMRLWFEEELYPMMLDVEAEVEQKMSRRNASSSREENLRRRRGGTKAAYGCWSKNDRTNLHRRERDFVRSDAYEKSQAYSRIDLPLEMSCSRHYNANSQVVDGFYDKEEVMDDERDDHVAIEQLQQFLQESAAHQRHMTEVRRQRREAEAQYVPDTQGPVEIPLPSEAAPQSQPHKSRFDALVCLYGDSADSIVSMETNLQARFDRSVDASRPRYWPIIPLRF